MSTNYKMEITKIIMSKKNVIPTNKPAKKHKWFLLVLILLCYLLLAVLPYRKQGGVSPETMETFELSDYYGDEVSSARAAILTTNEEALTERLRLIQQASRRIVLSTFDFQADNSGKLMLAALYDAASRGVEVNILIDGFSYLAHTTRGIDYFLALGQLENVTIKVYNPASLLQPQKSMARLHDKYLIIDDSAYILGGRNTYDFFLGTDTDYLNYDWDVLVYETASTPDVSLNQLQSYFSALWDSKDCRISCDSTPFFLKKKVTAATQILINLHTEALQSHPDWFTPIDYEAMTVPVNHISLLSNPTETSVKEPVLFYQMTELMLQSGEAVTFHTPYILCNDYMMERLQLLCDGNHSVTMMTNSVANNGNPFGSADYSIHRQELLDTGLSILEYDNGVSYHGKCFTIGNRLTGIGSFNWDMRSAYLDTELMLVIDSEPLNALMQASMAQYEADSLIVCPDGTYSLQEGQTPQSLTPSKNLLLKLVRPLSRFVRYLM